MRIVAPLLVEHVAIRRALHAAGMDAQAVTLLRSRAGRRARLAGLAGGGAVAVLGVCGALDASLRPGDIVVATEIRDEAGATISLPSAPILAAAVRAAGGEPHLRPMLSTSRLVLGRAARRRLAETGAAAVDMESFGLLAAAGDVPLALLRVVVDTPAQPLVRPAVVRRGTLALSTLASMVPAVLAWGAATGPRDVSLAEPRSFCAGVERAITTVERTIDLTDGPVYVRRQVVHNAHVVADLTHRGAVFIQELAEAPDGATVVLSAHGVAPAVRSDAARRRMRVIDATCPLVAKVHAEARHAALRGDTTIVIGHADHEEVVGTVGEAPSSTTVIGSVAEVDALELGDERRLTWLAQTTLAVEEISDIVGALERRFPHGAGQAASDVCYATTNRQQAVRQVAATVDVVLVLGSVNSSNSLRLVEVAQRCGTPAHLLEDAAHLDPGWLRGARRVGITAGASAPPRLVEELVHALTGLGPLEVTSASGISEDIAFELPKELRIS